MFKEIVSLAIILGFILNIIYVAHPNTTSYTIAFVLSLIALSPFVLLWRYRNVLKDRIRKLRGRYQKADR
jgi:O-antigen/teichoic acid export membrane protein